MAALLCDLKEGDEVILPSYTFVSTADAFVLRGAKAVFVDIRPDTMNIDETLIEGAITERTKAIFVVHYAGVACEMDKIMRIAKNYNLKVVEDAAQAVCSFYKGKPLGTIGDFGCYSFHETKNLSMGEGGAMEAGVDPAGLLTQLLIGTAERGGILLLHNGIFLADFVQILQQLLGVHLQDLHGLQQL